MNRVKRWISPEMENEGMVDFVDESQDSPEYYPKEENFGAANLPRILIEMATRRRKRQTPTNRMDHLARFARREYPDTYTMDHLSRFAQREIPPNRMNHLVRFVRRGGNWGERQKRPEHIPEKVFRSLHDIY